MRLDHVDRALEPVLDEEGEPGRMLHDLIVGIGLVGELEAHAVPRPGRSRTRASGLNRRAAVSARDRISIAHSVKASTWAV